jgi:hypothetical protein
VTEEPDIRQEPFTPGTRYLGSITAFLRAAEKAHATKESKVPCGECNACCRSPKMLVDLMPDELSRFPEAVPAAEIDTVSERSSGYILPKNADGSCAKLVDGKCSIYADRPSACRSYDCRWGVFLRIADDEVMGAALKEWAAPIFPERKDRQILCAMGLAMIAGGHPRSVGEALLKITHYPDYMHRAKKMLTTFRREHGQSGA